MTRHQQAPAESPTSFRSATNRFILLLLLVSAMGCTSPDHSIEQMATNWINVEPFPEIPADNLAEAQRIQTQFVDALKPEMGPMVGYKAGLTTMASQKKFGMDSPVRGTLLKNMFASSGADIPVSYGVQPLIEGDLLVRVARKTINEAETDEELVNALDALFPLLELPDLAYASGVEVTGAGLVAANVGARKLVVGDTIPLASGPAGLDQLGGINVQLLDGKGNDLSSGSTEQLMGHPINVVRWIRDSLVKEGKKLKPGMVLCLGSITELLPVEGPRTYRARYSRVYSKSSDTSIVAVTIRP